MTAFEGFSFVIDDGSPKPEPVSYVVTYMPCEKCLIMVPVGSYHDCHGQTRPGEAPYDPHRTTTTGTG